MGDISGNYSVSMNTTLSGVNESFASILLNAKNDENALLLLPVIIFASILMMLGFVGNSLVCYVYMLPNARSKRTTQRTFILTLAIFDIFNCSLVIPFEIYDMRNQYSFTAHVTCTLFRFIETVLVLSSGFTLVSISVDRYVHLVKPSKTILTPKRAKLLACVCVLLSLCISWPMLFFAGTEKFDIVYLGYNLTAEECTSFRANAHERLSAKLYSYILMLIFISALITLIVIYTFIGIKLFKRRRGSTKNGLTYIGREKSTSSAKNELLLSEMDSSISDTKDKKKETRLLADRPRRQDMRKSNVGYVIGKSKAQVRGPTIVFYSVTVVFILGFLPHLLVRILRLTGKAFTDNHAADYTELLYNLFVRSYMINNAVNPFIYSILNVNFRRELISAFKRCLCYCK